MPERKIGKLSQIVKAYPKSNDNSGHLIDITITEATMKHIEFWHENVQKTYVKKDDKRADKKWNWVWNFKFYKRLMGLLRQSPKCYCICMNKRGRFIPLGLVLLAGEYPYLENHEENSSFIWYLTTAPKAFLLNYLDEKEIPDISNITVDIGVTLSFQNSHEGKMGLHAAPEGGQWLIDFYEGCSLKQLDPDARLPNGIRKFIAKNDGRYFYFDSQSAFAFSTSLDSLRV
ncbi:TPA: hypothetical protein ACVU4C_001000 [Vibrio parahaemolyticus]|uniref:hypothetical protein n=1 Tax=Vibrio parahaemolyticus TaxID=670 RepID=UPI00044BD9C6|nr:hypothetical protein [Vibrio parahaemolyticus]ETZ08599.1 hypothetical protein AJ90_05030 [Vibrio parahaemolyticus M0605]ELB2035716.1 hypothetical protein [Vibrio parahaemolyticus]ELY2120720.1 hypothetical protein [Vibrio parahaemolyticus]MBD6964849.1 hypothetical protein [Vibrio parahaemolyticus]TOG32586.1 hypothetical protein CGJ04_04615 [Vibrio parahaemolyticus]